MDRVEGLPKTVPLFTQLASRLKLRVTCVQVRPGWTRASPSYSGTRMGS